MAIERKCANCGEMVKITFFDITHKWSGAKSVFRCPHCRVMTNNNGYTITVEYGEPYENEVSLQDYKLLLETRSCDNPLTQKQKKRNLNSNSNSNCNSN